jgi:hypothetical protein
MQMPPLGTRVADAEALDVIERWIVQLKPHRQESRP